MDWIDRYGKKIADAIAKHGDDIIDIFIKHGNEAIEVVAEHGDDAVDGFKNGKTPTLDCGENTIHEKMKSVILYAY